MTADVDALRCIDLALGDKPKLGVGEGVEGRTAHPQQPRAQEALDLEPQRALGAGHRALAFDPQLPIDTAQVPRPMIDIGRHTYTMKVQARVSGHDGRVNLKH